MKRRCLLLMIALMLVLPCNGGLGHAADAPDQPSATDLPGVAWEELRYQAASWAVDLTADIKLDALPAAEAEAVLLKSSRGGGFQSAGPVTRHLSLEMVLDVAFKPPVTITNDVWFDPDDARPLGRFRLRRGEDEFAKTYRFTEKGVFRRNREPRGAAEASLEPHQWAERGNKFYPYDLEALGCPGITDRLLLIYIVSAAGFKDNRPLSLCVFGKRQLHRVELRPDGKQTIDVDFLEIKPSSAKHRRGEVEVLTIKLVSASLASDLDEPENFSFLGLHRNIEICIDPESRLPLRISGDISNMASGDLKLIEAKLK